MSYHHHRVIGCKMSCFTCKPSRTRWRVLCTMYQPPCPPGRPVNVDLFVLTSGDLLYCFRSVGLVSCPLDLDTLWSWSGPGGFSCNRRWRGGRCCTLLALRIWNMSGRPCVTSSWVYSSSSIQLNSFSRPWISGRRCWLKHVRRDSSQVCRVHGTPGEQSHTWLNTSHTCSCDQPVFVHSPRLRMSMVMSTCPCSALWYMASFRALSLAFPVRIRSRSEELLPSSSEPSARISSRDKTSAFPFSVWDNNFRKTFLEGEKKEAQKQEKG